MTQPTQCIRTVGRCIYCDTADGPLSDEHIIPFALGANLTLGAASCRACATITGGVEQHVTRPIAGMLRARLGLQTRRPAQRAAIPKMLFFGQTRRRVQVAPEDFPSVFSYPIFDKPGILAGRTRAGVYRHSELPWSAGQDADFEAKAAAFKAKYRCTGFELSSYRPNVLMPFIAKIAHATAVALLGPDGFKPLIREAAIHPGRVFDDLLGGQAGSFAPNRQALHYVEMRQLEGPAGSLIFVRLNWFWSVQASADPTLTIYPGSAPPPLVAIVGRPTDDRLVGKLGRIEISTTGEESWALHDLPSAAAQVIRGPSMNP